MYKASQAYPIGPLPDWWHQLVFFDIETTGFHRQRDQVGLISLAFIRGEQLELVQYFAEQSAEEGLILTLALQQLSQYLVTVSYNGDRFDIPFVNARAKHLAVGGQLNPKRSLDLYRQQPGGKLKQTELDSGFIRTDELSGADWANGYKDYLKQPNSQLRQLLLLHNQEDVLSVVQLLQASPAIQTMIEDRIILEPTSTYLTDIIVAPGNLRVKLTNRQNTTTQHDIPLIDTPDFSILDDPLFDQTSDDSKANLVLIEHNQPMVGRIKRLIESLIQ